MTFTEANKLAAHIEFPEVAPLCEHGHAKTQKKSRWGTYYWHCCECQAERSRAHEAKRAAERNGRPHHDIDRNTRWCPVCEEPMVFTETPSQPKGQWCCKPCETTRKKAGEAARAQAAKDAALSVTELAKRHYMKAWRNIQRLPAIEREVTG
jgi:transposase-like protein